MGAPVILLVVSVFFVLHVEASHAGHEAPTTAAGPLPTGLVMSDLINSWYVKWPPTKVSISLESSYSIERTGSGVILHVVTCTWSNCKNTTSAPVEPSTNNTYPATGGWAQVYNIHFGETIYMKKQQDGTLSLVGLEDGRTFTGQGSTKGIKKKKKRPKANVYDSTCGPTIVTETQEQKNISNSFTWLRFDERRPRECGTT